MRDTVENGLYGNWHPIRESIERILFSQTGLIDTNA